MVLGMLRPQGRESDPGHLIRKSLLIFWLTLHVQTLAVGRSLAVGGFQKVDWGDRGEGGLDAAIYASIFISRYLCRSCSILIHMAFIP